MSASFMDERPGTGSSGSRTFISYDPPTPSQLRHAPIFPDPNTPYSKSEDVERGGGDASRSSLWGYLTTEVDSASARCIASLTAFCFMTGYLDAVVFSAVFIWCGPQTGNTMQLSFTLARLFEDPAALRDPTFKRTYQQALCALLAFNLGILLGRIGDRIGPAKRIWLASATFFQALFTMAAAIVIWKSGESSISAGRADQAWTDPLTFAGLLFISMSLGLQGVLGRRLETHFGTTIPLTSIWVELISDPSLFKLRRKVASRDQKTLAIVAFFVGGFCGRALTAKIGAPGTLGIGVGFRVLIAISWIFVPAKTLGR